MYTSQMTPGISFSELLSRKRPDAAAWITGNVQNPRLSGLVKFYRTDYGGVLVEAEIFGLPNIETEGSSDFYAMHIHEFGDCSGDFSNTGSHYNPEKRPHPEHAGDLLPLPGSQGYAWSAFYDKRFTLDEIIGKFVIIHAGRDDFTTQPSGDSGTKIGCGEIRRMV
ncbi:superoxide dismutase family protein [Lachnospiraceae bacterium 54-11]